VSPIHFSVWPSSPSQTTQHTHSQKTFSQDTMYLFLIEPKTHWSSYLQKCLRKTFANHTIYVSLGYSLVAGYTCTSPDTANTHSSLVNCWLSNSPSWVVYKTTKEFHWALGVCYQRVRVQTVLNVVRALEKARWNRQTDRLPCQENTCVWGHLVGWFLQ